MRRRLISLLVIVLIGVMPIAHAICLAGCSEKTSSTTQSHHHDGAQAPEHQVAGHAVHGSHVAVIGHRHGRDAVKALASAPKCCTFVAAPACSRGGDDSTLLVSTMKRTLDPPATTAAQAIAILGAAGDDRPTSSLNARICPPAFLVHPTPLRI
jgi:hypothetical protein